VKKLMFLYRCNHFRKFGYFFAEFGYFWSDFGYSFVLPSGNPDVAARRWRQMQRNGHR